MPVPNEKIVYMNELLAKQKYSELCDYIDTNEISDVSSKYKPIYVMTAMKNIYIEEKRQGIVHHVFDGRTLEELLMLYVKVSFCLRRIEFGLEEELIIDALSQLMENKVSLICCIGVIQANVYFYNKEMLINRMVDLYQIMEENS